MLIGIVALLAGAGTRAYFFDTGTSTDNIFSSGTIILELHDGIYWDETTKRFIYGSNLAPGDYVPPPPFTATINFQNSPSSTISSSKIDINFMLGGGSPFGMDHYILIDLLTVSTIDENGALKFFDLSGDFATLEDLIADETGLLVGLPAYFAPGQEGELAMRIQFDPLMPNDYQGAQINMTVQFTLWQAGYNG
jgi:predicted ribosomally synthesized peptide with SipW-like signal peptide